MKEDKLLDMKIISQIGSFIMAMKKNLIKIQTKHINLKISKKTKKEKLMILKKID